MSSLHFYRPVDHVDVQKVKVADPDQAVRLYCKSSGERWSLQVRGFLLLSDRRKSSTFTIATATLSVEDLKALRDAVDAFLKEVVDDEERVLDDVREGLAEALTVEELERWAETGEWPKGGAVAKE